MSGLFWKLNRLRVMSGREVLFRAGRTLSERLEHFRVARGWTPAVVDVPRSGCGLFGSGPALADDWRKKYQLDFDRLSEYLQGRIGIFGHDALSIGDPVDWHRDPVTRTEAPLVFGKTLNYRDDSIVGNVKFTWELGRHQHLVPLAVAYAVTGETHYRQAIVRQIESWINQNPYGMGIHWCSSLEVALRLISWTLVHGLLVLRDGDKGLFSAVEDQFQLGRSIYQQAYFVRHFLSRNSSSNNHLIGELTGLWAATRVFDLGDEGVVWASFARDELEREAVKQVYDDGVNKEQAFYYHLWVLEYFLFAHVVGIRTGRSLSNRFVDRIVAMAQFLRDVSPEEGEPPQVGDADDGFVANFDPVWPSEPYSEVLDAFDAVFRTSRSDMRQKAFWYQSIGTDFRGGLPNLRESPRYPVLYPEGGYAILGGRGCHLVFDAGALGYLGIAAHGHADALSFCLAVDGMWWLVDPGTYAYHSAASWRNYFRGTAAHNTIRVNQRDQSEIGGAFLWLRKADAWLEDFGEMGLIQYVKGCHTGYLQSGITHCREIRFSELECELEVKDLLTGGGRKQAEIHYHFAPAVDIRKSDDDNLWVASLQSSKKRLLFYTDPAWKYTIVKGSNDPILGWYSPALKEKVPAYTLRGMALSQTESECVTRIVIE